MNPKLTRLMQRSKSSIGHKSTILIENNHGKIKFFSEKKHAAFSIYPVKKTPTFARQTNQMLWFSAAACFFYISCQPS
jgi:hypothetical protein